MIERVGPSGLEILGISKSGASRQLQKTCRAFGPQYKNVLLQNAQASDLESKLTSAVFTN